MRIIRAASSLVAMLCVAALGCGRVGFADAVADASFADAGAVADAAAGVDGGPTPDAGPRDAGLIDAGGVDSGATHDGGSDAGPSCTPSAETCNRLDDDCDGFADEGLLVVTSIPRPMVGSATEAPEGYDSAVGWDPIESRFGLAWKTSNPLGGGPFGLRFAVIDETGVIIGPGAWPVASSSSAIFSTGASFTGTDWVVPFAPAGGGTRFERISVMGMGAGSRTVSGSSTLEIGSALGHFGTENLLAIAEWVTPGLRAFVVDIDSSMIYGPATISDPRCAFMVDPGVVATPAGFGVAYACQPTSGPPFVAYQAIDTRARLGASIELAMDAGQERDTRPCYDPVTDRVAISFLESGPTGPVSASFVAVAPDASSAGPERALAGQRFLMASSCASDGTIAIIGNESGASPMTFRRWRISDGAHVPGDLMTVDIFTMTGIATGSRYFALGGAAGGTVVVGAVDCR